MKIAAENHFSGFEAFQCLAVECERLLKRQVLPASISEALDLVQKQITSTFKPEEFISPKFYKEAGCQTGWSTQLIRSVRDPRIDAAQLAGQEWTILTNRYYKETREFVAYVSNPFQEIIQVAHCSQGFVEISSNLWTGNGLAQLSIKQFHGNDKILRRKIHRKWEETLPPTLKELA